ncbi:MAG TPA: hypothetical protein VEY12_12920 [Thermoplasmata archaeon]|nr:hypothetical protein [Thermoplasmata archaeon]
MSFNVTIAKRAMRLGILYVGASFFLALLGIILSVVSGLVPNNLNTAGSPVDVQAYLSLIPVALVSIAGLMAAAPVSLLFVHDKDNGTLEYLLSMGFDQRDVFRAYLAASLILGLPAIVVGGVTSGLVALLLGRGVALAATVVVCSLALGPAVVALVTVLMSAFTSLQRQPMGMNQPLGIAIGAFVLVGAMLAPLATGSLAVVVELIISAVVAAVSLGLLAATPRLIRREKMLP